jgi:glutaminase
VTPTVLVGVNATRPAFNSVDAVERGGGRTNPMVKAGAIAAAGLIPRRAGLSAFRRSQARARVRARARARGLRVGLGNEPPQPGGRHRLAEQGGLGTFSPPLDAAGNSVRGQLAAAHLSRRLGLDLFATEPL